MTLKDRLKEVRDYAKMGQTNFEKHTGISGGYFNNLKSSIGSDTVLKIVDKFPELNIDWLITGKGSMLKSETQTPSITKLPNEDNTVNYKLVPLLNLDAVGGMHSLNNEPGDNEYIDKLIPFTDAQDGDVALMVSGESMSPTCPSGSKILIREVESWREYFGYGNIFVLLLTDGRRILKEVQKWQEDSKNYILCKSHNDKYPEEELPKSMIAGVWKVIKILNERGW